MTPGQARFALGQPPGRRATVRPAATTLRDYQAAAVEAARRSWRVDAGKGALIVLPTGAGKTRVAVELAIQEARAGRRVLWLAHREELLDQARAAYAREGGVLAGTLKGDVDESSARVVFGSVDTLANAARRRRLLEAGPLGLIVVDEAHHSVAPTWRRAIGGLRKGPRPPLLLGLTATPRRHDGKPLSGLWRVAYTYDVADAQAEGHLVHYDHVVRTGIQDLVAGAVAEVRRAGSRRRVLVFTATVAEAQDVARGLARAGVRAAWVSGEMPGEVRRRVLEHFRAGRTRVLANAALLTEGTDLPSCDMVVVARTLGSQPLHQQMLGRALRPSPGKGRALLVSLEAA